MSNTNPTPEASAIPRPTAPATPATPAPTDVIDAVMAFLTSKATNPIEQMALSTAAGIINQSKTQLSGLLGGGPLTVKSVVDTMFSYVEGKARRPFVKYVLKGLNVLLDDVGLPILQAYLLSVGISLPLA